MSFQKTGPIGIWFWRFDGPRGSSFLYYLLIHSTGRFWALPRCQVLCPALALKWRTGHHPCSHRASMLGGEMSQGHM